MLWSTFLLLLAIAHVTLAIGITAAEFGLPEWLAPPTMTLATMLFAILSITAQNIERVADNGDVITVSDPVVGIYALTLAAVSLVLTAVVVINWLPTSSLTGGSSSGF